MENFKFYEKTFVIVIPLVVEWVGGGRREDSKANFSTFNNRCETLQSLPVNVLKVMTFMQNNSNFP